MDKQAELGIVRAAYAKQVLAAASVKDARLAQAFAAIPREDFVGPGPWLVLRWLRNYVPTPTRSISIPTIWSRLCPSAMSTTGNRRCTPTLSIRHYPPPASTWCMLAPARAITRRSSHISSDRQVG